MKTPAMLLCWLLMTCGVGFAAGQHGPPLMGHMCYDCPTCINPGPTEDDASYYVELPDPFVFYQTSYDGFYINDNAILSFMWPFEEFVPRAFKHSDPDLIALFWADHNVEAGGMISWEEVYILDLPAIGEIIEGSFGSCGQGFTPTSGVIVSYCGVPSYCDKGFGNTYQAVLVTDGSNSYVMFNYVLFNWFEGCSDEHSIVGFNAGGDHRHYQMPHDDVMSCLTDGSNVGTAGRYVYKVDGWAILGPDCHPVDGLNFELSCSSISLPSSLATYDGEDLGITRAQKTKVSIWEAASTVYPCKFMLVSLTRDIYEGQSVPLYVWFFNFGIGTHTGNAAKLHRTFQIQEGRLYLRGQGEGGDEATMPHYYLSPDHAADALVYTVGDTVYVRSSKCPYALDVTYSGYVTTGFRLRVKDGYFPNMDGMCRDGNWDAGNDFTLCKTWAPAGTVDDITTSCARG